MLLYFYHWMSLDKLSPLESTQVTVTLQMTLLSNFCFWWPKFHINEKTNDFFYYRQSRTFGVGVNIFLFTGHITFLLLLSTSNKLLLFSLIWKLTVGKYVKNYLGFPKNDLIWDYKKDNPTTFDQFFKAIFQLHYRSKISRAFGFIFYLFSFIFKNLF